MIKMWGGGTINLKSGSTIKLCAAAAGGAIGAYNYSRLNVYGGTIQDCAAGVAGGAIVATIRDNTPASTVSQINMYGGTIKNCYAPKGGAFDFEDGSSYHYLLGGTIVNCNKYSNSESIYFGATDATNAKSSLANGNYFYYSDYFKVEGSKLFNGTTINSTTKRDNYTCFVKSNTVKITIKYDKNTTLAEVAIPSGNSLGAIFPGDPTRDDGAGFYGWYDTSDNKVTKSTTFSSDATISPKFHKHSNTYFTTGTSVGCYCSSTENTEFCSYNSSANAVTVKISVPDCVHIGDSFTANSSATAWKNLGLASLAVKYTGRNNTTYNSTTAPTTKGDYKLTLSVSGQNKSVSKNFEVNHFWSYSTATNKIIASCTKSNCTYNKSKTPVSVEIQVPNCVHMNTSYSTISSTTAWADLGLPSLTVNYTGRENTAYNSSTAPSARGDYILNLNLTGKGMSVSKNFEVNHLWSYSTSATDTLVAACTQANCVYNSSKTPVCVSIVVPDCPHIGKSYSTTTDLTLWNSLELSPISASFAGRNSTVYSNSSEPTTLGDYTCSISASGKTATKDYKVGHYFAFSTTQTNKIMATCMEEGCSLKENPLFLNIATNIFNFDAKIGPEDANNKSVHWTSSDKEAINFFHDGCITVLKTSSQNEPISVVVNSTDGSNLFHTCLITVVSSEPK